ncbi:carbohydrate ABC transporter permease [Bariatricus sp. SGI.161]|uniref:carbohydrate ABC transporter permease n=1 Tax=Bariatricus sp. SGI.161 TaxID=3420550 RepID=UPI003060867B|nr:sugar ABC transporter permease [Lachnospiraceae bacterium]
MRSTQRKRIIGSLAPLLILLCFVYAYPLINVCISAFRGFTGSSAGTFVGLKNFEIIKGDIPSTVITTLIWTFGSVIPAMVLGLALALICNQTFRGKKAVVAINLLPYAIPLIIVASCWRFVYNQDFGIINVALKSLGIIDESIQFLDYDHALVAVVVARIWRATPFAFMNYYSALTTIPADQYEAARVDGANAIQNFFYVTLPNLKEITSSTLTVLTVWTFLVFDIIYGMTGGGPVDATMTISMRIYREMFSLKNQGTSSAWSMIAIIILVIITLFYWKFIDKEETE